jgi:hypothetical protein
LEKEEREEDPISKKSAKFELKPIRGNFTEKDIKYENKLDRKYFRQDVVTLAKSLLGKVFIRETEDGIMKAVIV